MHLLTAVLGGMLAAGPLATDMYLVALPQIAMDLGSGSTGAQWTLSAFLVGYGLGPLVYGPLSDRVGRREPAIAGFVLFGLSSVLCALSSHPSTLLLWRVMQGLGASSGVVIARAVARDCYRPQDMARMLSILTMIVGFMAILAPALGAWLLDMGTWRIHFWIMAVFAAALLAAILHCLPETRDPASAPEGVARSYGELLKDSNYVLNACAYGLLAAAFFAYMGSAADLLVQRGGLTTSQLGWILSANALGYVLAAHANRRLLGRFAPRQILRAASLAILAAAVVAITLVIARPFDTRLLAAPFAVTVACLGFTQPNLLTIAMSKQGQRAGAAAAGLGLMQFCCGAAGAALATVMRDISADAAIWVVSSTSLFAVCLVRTSLRARAFSRLYADTHTCE